MNTEKKRKYTKKEGLFVPARQVSMLAAGALTIAAVLFMGGYFIGKKHMMEQFVAQAETDSFADQVYSSMCALYDADTGGESILLAVEDEQDPSSLDELRRTSDEGEEPLLVQNTKNSVDSSFTYVGQLLSYHVRRYADSFVQRLAKKNIPLEVRTRKSVTAGGEAKEWYQVVTKPYTDRHELEVVVEQLSREEKIEGAHIIVC